MKKFIICLMASALFAGAVYAELSVQEKHEKMLYPSVRVTYGRGGGSGTVIYSRMNDEGKYSTYVVTNCHVIWAAISFVKPPGKEEEKEKRNYVWSEIFTYKNMSDPTGTYKIKTAIVEYDKDKDLAILKLVSDEPIKYVATLKPRGKLTLVSEPVTVVGSPILLPPYYVEWVLSQKGLLIDALEYWMTTAPIISGNSGGSMYDEDGLFIGIPSRVVADGWYVSNQIPHLGVFIPVVRLYDLLDEWGMQFLYDSSYTEEDYLNPPEEKEEE